jgi:hypothetical protein
MRELTRWPQPAFPRYGLKIFLGGLAITFSLEWAFMRVRHLLLGTAPDEWNQRIGFRAWVILVLCGWGVWRAYLINPAYAASYRRWLETTPWTPDKPLPLGEVRLNWLDGLLLFTASLVCWRWPLSWYAPLAFLLPYSLLLTLVNYRAGQDWHALIAVALAALLPLAMMQREAPWTSTLLGFLIAIASTTGWRRSLNSFPWNDSPRWNNFPFSHPDLARERSICRWWPLVHPAADFRFGPEATWRETVMTAGLWGWLAGAAVFTMDHLGLRAIPPSDDVPMTLDVAWLLTLTIGICASALRLMRYMPWCLSPINILGRISTKRWFIPGYDRVFIAPAAAILVAATLPILFHGLGIGPAPTAFLATVATVFTAIGMGPTLANWGLTGEYRMSTRMPVGRSREMRDSRSAETRGRGHGPKDS